MVQLVLDRMSILIRSDRTRTVGPYAYGWTVRVYLYGLDRTRTVQIRICSGTYIYIFLELWIFVTNYEIYIMTVYPPPFSNLKDKNGHIKFIFSSLVFGVFLKCEFWWGKILFLNYLSQQAITCYSQIYLNSGAQFWFGV